MKSRWIVVTAVLLLANGAVADVFVVNQPWVTPGTRNSEAYMRLTSSAGATLIGVESAVARQAMLVRGPARPPGRRQRTLEAIDLPAATTVRLEPGGARIALTGLAAPLREGERVALVLFVQDAGGSRRAIPVNAEVRSDWPGEAEARRHRHRRRTRRERHEPRSTAARTSAARTGRPEHAGLRRRERTQQ